MPLLKNIKTPNGASVGYHVVTKLAADLLSEHAVVLATVNSWADEETYILSGGKMASWEWTVPIPRAPLETPGPLSDITEEVLTILEGDLFPFNGASRVVLPDGLDAAKARKWAVMKQTRSMMSCQPITMDGAVYDADKTSVDNVRGAIQGMEISGASSINWTLADNTSKTLTLAELRNLGMLMLAQIDNCFQTARTIREQIEACQTTEELEQVGWPIS